MVTKTRVHPVLLIATGLWLATAAAAALEWGNTISSHTYAAGALATAVSIIGIALNSRRLTVVATKFVGRAIVRAPREAEWRGYGLGMADALAGGPGEDTRDLSGR